MDKAIEAAAADQAELEQMLSDWRAFKQAFWDGFCGRPFLELEKDHG